MAIRDPIQTYVNSATTTVAFPDRMSRATDDVSRPGLASPSAETGSGAGNEDETGDSSNFCTSALSGAKRSLSGPISESPAKKQSKWSPDEDKLIIELRQGGMKWEDISKHLKGRSAISCRLHYQNYLERRSEWDEERKTKLARLYERFKAEMWAKVAEELAVPWRAAEAMHWQLGEQDIARRAGVVPFALAAASEPSRKPPQHNREHSGSLKYRFVPPPSGHSSSFTSRRDSMSGRLAQAQNIQQQPQQQPLQPPHQYTQQPPRQQPSLPYQQQQQPQPQQHQTQQQQQQPPLTSLHLPQMSPYHRHAHPLPHQSIQPMTAHHRVTQYRPPMPPLSLSHQLHASPTMESGTHMQDVRSPNSIASPVISGLTALPPLQGSPGPRQMLPSLAQMTTGIGAFPALTASYPAGMLGVPSPESGSSPGISSSHFPSPLGLGFIRQIGPFSESEPSSGRGPDVWQKQPQSAKETGLSDRSEGRPDSRSDEW